jgi:hypothetical protein
MFTGEIVPLPRLAAELDLLLKSLVTNFDDEELPLRMKERELQLIIDSDGNRQLAEQRLAAEANAFDEKVSFTALLTNAAMHPEISKASLATQRYGVALSRDWIIRAHEKLTSHARAMVPANISIRIEGWDRIPGWEGVTQDGRNERELLASHAEHVRRAEQEALAKVALSTVATLAPFIGGVLLLYGVVALVNIPALLAGAGALAYWFFERKSLVRKKEEVAAHFRRAGEEQAKVISLALAEVGRYRAELASHEAYFDDATAFLNSISPDENAFAHITDAPAVTV